MNQGYLDEIYYWRDSNNIYFFLENIFIFFCKNEIDCWKDETNRERTNHMKDQ
jgi:hypothetical protein